MENSLGGARFAPETTYLNTASSGLLPARSAAVLRQALDDAVTGRPTPGLGSESVERTREAFADLAGVPAGRVSAAASVSVHTGLIAASLPAGAEVLVADGDFSSLVAPFAARADLKVRSVPLESLAEAVRPGTALVAVSSVQSADGRIADLAAVREAAAAHEARTLVDASQSVGWLPFRADDFDYTVCGAFKWLLCPRGVSFLVVPEACDALPSVYASWPAAEDPRGSFYGPVRLARSASRYDQSHGLLPYLAAQHSIPVIGEVGGPAAVGAHNTALAERFRAGLARLGREPLPAPGSAIVSVPGLGRAEDALRAAGVQISARAGNLRVSFHLYNTAADVDRVLEVLSGLPDSP
ncbi:aminotransferase class V-fold PLP-dependent enzyme [Streptomyces sp. NPDC002055]|uniref:aminotransferase class V-fold PLP-dependent enzyme n=1 Tax=Streptomyces sp. NPDC002055 TaxID=3154534 RepID=UPI00331ED26F